MKRTILTTIAGAMKAARRYGYHIMFAVTICSLALLVSWWSVFIRSAIVQQRQAQYDTVQAQMEAYAMAMGHRRAQEPQAGSVSDTLEVVACSDAGGGLHMTMQPFWSETCVRPRPSWIAATDKKYHSRTVMVFGESSVLLLVVLVSSFMLYRMIYVERQTAKELNEFFSRVTHEIKTPITGIKAFLQTLQAQNLSKEQLAPLLHMALQQIERQEMLTENILIGQRMTRGGWGMQISNLGALVSDYLHMHKGLLHDVQIAFTDESGGATHVSADHDAVRVVLENLVDNAQKYGGKPLVLEIAVKKNDGAGVLTFTDHGIGFDPRHAAAIFEAFRRLTEDLPEGRHGTGMGLYLSRKLARQMGGTLSAKSEGKGQGATFTLTLPLLRGGEHA